MGGVGLLAFIGFHLMALSGIDKGIRCTRELLGRLAFIKGRT